MRPDGTSPKMNKDCRMLVRNWLTVAMHTENKEQIFILEKLLATAEPLEKEDNLSQESIDQMLNQPLRGAK